MCFKKWKYQRKLNARYTNQHQRLLQRTACRLSHQEKGSAWNQNVIAKKESRAQGIPISSFYRGQLLWAPAGKRFPGEDWSWNPRPHHITPSLFLCLILATKGNQTEAYLDACVLMHVCLRAYIPWRCSKMWGKARSLKAARSVLQSKPNLPLTSYATLEEPLSPLGASAASILTNHNPRES